jgi:hypothetical protein
VYGRLGSADVVGVDGRLWQPSDSFGNIAAARARLSVIKYL